MSLDTGTTRDPPRSGRWLGKAGIRFGTEDLASLFGEAMVLHEALVRIADHALLALPIAEGAVVRLVNHTDRGGAGAPVARRVDDLHDSLGEGPAVDALDAGKAACWSLGRNDRWRRFGPRADRMGLRSALSLPLIVAGAPVGVLTAYAGAQDAFTEFDVGAAEYYGRLAAVVVRNAWLLEQSRQRAEQLTEAIRVRPPIDRAVGVIMSRTGKSADEALDSLRRMSNRRHLKVSDVSAELVDEAVRRAQRRISGRPNSAPSDQIVPAESS
jgi:ANTAR domain/GAF domain